MTTITAVFGRVIDGMNTVDAIRYVKTARQQMPNMPIETVTIDRMTILTPEEAKTAMEDAAKKQAEAPETPVYPVSTAAFGRYDRSRDRSIESIGSVGSVLRSDRRETSGKRVSDDLQLSIF